MITSGNYTISSDGVYMLASGYQGTVTIANGVQNVKIQQQTPSIALNEAFIVGPSSGGANLWIDGLNISNTTDKSIIDFQGTNNYLTLQGNNTLTTYPVSNAATLALPQHNTAIVHIGDGLTIESDGNASLNIQGISNVYGTIFPHTYLGAGIGTNNGENSNANISITGGQINVKMEDGYGAAIGGGANYNAGKKSTIGDIVIAGGFINASVTTSSFLRTRSAYSQTGFGAGIGGGYGQIGNDIIIQNATVTAFSETGAAIGSGDGGDWNDIDIVNSIVNARSYVGAGIGAGRGASTVNNITITDSNVTAICDNNDVIVGPITSFKGENIGKGTYNSRVLGNITITGTYSGNSTSSGAGNTSTSASNTKIYYGNPLVIHHGTKSNQALNCYINDMDTDAMGLSNTKISTRDDAIQAFSDDTTGRIGAIDAAIEYALGEATNVGAYISRLEHTEENLVTANENTQASESTIRDADMAKEMTEYTKYSLLTQSSQAMLAQANQNGSQVLSLLQ